VRCFGLNGEFLTPDDRRIEVRVSGQSSLANALFAPKGKPVISEVAPNEAAARSTVVILGRNFGEQSTDLASITVDGIPCLSIDHRSDSVVTC